LRVVAHVPVELEAVAAAGDEHVVVAVGAQLHGLAQLGRGHGGHAGEQGALALLAAKATTHAPADHVDLVRRPVQRVCHHLLHLARVLGGAVDEHAAILLRHGQADLPLEVELLLPAQRPLALPAVRRGGQRGVRVAARQVHGRHHILLQRVRLPGAQHGRQRIEAHRLRGQRGGAARLLAGARHHGEHGLPHVPQFATGLPVLVHHLRGEDGVVLDDGAAIIGAGDVGAGEHGHHAGLRAQQGEIEVAQLAVGHGRQAQRRMQQAGDLGQIVHIGCGAGHVQVGGFMRQGLACSGLGLHAEASVPWAGKPPSLAGQTETSALLSGASGRVSSQKRCSRLRAARWR